MQLRHQFSNVNLDDEWDMEKFDVVCCFEVIEHIVKDGRLFRLLCSQVDDNCLYFGKKKRSDMLSVSYLASLRACHEGDCRSGRGHQV